jgi:lauroyl/myristoyl acyltransferase
MKRMRGRGFGLGGLSGFMQWRLNPILARFLPRRLGRIYLGLLGKFYYFFNREEEQQIKQNISAVIRRLPRREPIDLVIRRTFEGISAHYYEKLFIAYVNFGKVCRFLHERVKLEGRQLLDEALSEGKGVILVTGHFGAVEFLPLTLALMGYEVTMVVRFKTERLKRALIHRTKYVPITLLDANDGERVLFSALQALRSNQILITECDEFKAWRPHRSRRTQFLGCFCPLDRTLDLLQRRYDSPVIMGLVQRNRGSTFGLKLHSLNGIHQMPAGAPIAQRALQLLEQYIYSAPYQWYQWKEARIVFGTNILEETRPIHAVEADPPISFADSAMHAY